VRESVAAIFLRDNKIFTIVRQEYLKAFPGYCAFPGGKVDTTDGVTESLHEALVREMQEELGVNIDANEDCISSITKVGIAVTPSFNPYRFKTHYYVINLKKDLPFTVDTGEAASSDWQTPSELLRSYKEGKLLVVPPMLMILDVLSVNINHKEVIDLSLPFDDGKQVPMIESIYGVKHFLPLSNTFRPANRTNAFLIGDAGKEVLIDPSPCDLDECEKFMKALDRLNISKIFITHHHPDHHEYLRSFEQRYKVAIGMSVKTYELLNAKYGADYLEGMSIEIYQEGDVLTQSLKEDVIVYEVPGHDAGQLAIAPRSLSWFLVGDLIQTVGTVVVGGDDSDMTDYFNSLQKVIDLKPRFCIPSHGISIGGTFKVSKTLNHRKKRENDIKDLMDKGHDLDGIVSILYSELDESLVMYAKATVESHIIKIKKELSNL
jgi:glyoxylase-like metal-dependent hydrolase (beta-lactamase superfamily II)/8-oxo-dGTP pyrophosphatase MutT (NUDIX family)